MRMYQLLTVHHLYTVARFCDSSSSSCSCFFLTPCRIQKLYRKYKTAVTSVQDVVTAIVMRAVMENLPPCCEYTLMSVEITPASELRRPTLLLQGRKKSVKLVLRKTEL